jgi:hypothetical protein
MPHQAICRERLDTKLHDAVKQGSALVIGLERALSTVAQARFAGRS